MAAAPACLTPFQAQSHQALFYHCDLTRGTTQKAKENPDLSQQTKPSRLCPLLSLPGPDSAKPSTPPAPLAHSRLQGPSLFSVSKRLPIPLRRYLPQKTCVQSYTSTNQHEKQRQSRRKNGQKTGILTKQDRWPINVKALNFISHQRCKSDPKGKPSNTHQRRKGAAGKDRQPGCWREGRVPCPRPPGKPLRCTGHLLWVPVALQGMPPTEMHPQGQRTRT